jgi:probable F420-dependent oxidoreductase
MNDAEQRMKIGLHALHRGANTDPTELTRRAKHAEEVGFESLWVGDHIALPHDSPDPATEPRLEALIALTYLAATTTTIRLGVGVLVLPQRHPVLLAKQLASIDVLSRGRLIIGGGVGYVEGELAAFGIPLAERAQRTDEHLAAMRALWRHDPRFDGPTINYDGVVQYPPPHQQPSPPIILGGHAPGALQRAAHAGDGWFGWDLTPDQAHRYVRKLTELRCRSGRAAEPFEITVVPHDPFANDIIETFAEVGVHRLVLVPPAMTDDATDDTIALGTQLANDARRRTPHKENN